VISPVRSHGCGGIVIGIDAIPPRKDVAMKVFVAGASGAVGRRLVPLLAAGGHEVVGSTRRRESLHALAQLGATPVVADGLDHSLVRAIVEAEPEVVVHEMTGLAGAADLRHFDTAFELTTRLRTEGTDHLLEGARAAGARRVVAQSFGNWSYERRGGPVKTEEDPLDPDPPESMRRTLEGIRYLERAVTETDGLDGVVLRYANLYGPGTGFAGDGDVVEQVRRRRVPVVGSGEGVWSFVHVEDAARATVAAIEHGGPGIYNVADDDPVPAGVWLPRLAETVGAKPPRHVPEWLGRVAAGEAAVSMFTRIRGAANGKAKRELFWSPRFRSWRDGFRYELGPIGAAA
jgi:nucleoside-diphosphate-sugar epimerase